MRRLVFLQIVEGGGDVVSTSGGEVTLDLKSLLGQTQSNLGVGRRVEQKLPDDASQIVILQSDQLELAQDAVRLLKTLAVVFVVLSLAYFSLAIYLAEGWRREALQATGVGLLFAGAGALVARALAGDAVVDALATTDAGRRWYWSIGTSLMGPGGHRHRHLPGRDPVCRMVRGTHTLGARLASAIRFITDGRAGPGVSSAWWCSACSRGRPHPPSRQVIPALVLIGLLASGSRRCAARSREYPDARRRTPSGRLGAGSAGWAPVSGQGGRLALGAARAPRPTARQRRPRFGQYEQEKSRLLAERPRPRSLAPCAAGTRIPDSHGDRRAPLPDQARPHRREPALRMGAEPPTATASAWAGTAPPTTRLQPATEASARRNDLNMREIADHVQSPLFLAHIRAAVGSPVQQTNCHPFRYQRWLFVHNGLIKDMRLLRRDLLLEVEPNAVPRDRRLDGLGAALPPRSGVRTEEDPVGAMEQAVGLVEDRARGQGIDDPVQMTIGISDGERLWAIRYSFQHESRTLFVSEDVEALQRLHPENERLQRLREGDRVVVSEPLVDLPGAWHEVAESTALEVADGAVEQRAFAPGW